MPETLGVLVQVSGGLQTLASGQPDLVLLLLFVSSQKPGPFRKC